MKESLENEFLTWKANVFRLSLRKGTGIASRIRSNEVSLCDSSLQSTSDSKQKRGCCSLSPRSATQRPYVSSKGIIYACLK